MRPPGLDGVRVAEAIDRLGGLGLRNSGGEGRAGRAADAGPSSTSCRSAARRRRRRAPGRRRRRRGCLRRRRGRAAAHGSPAPRRRRAGARFAAKNACRVSQSPSTSACRRNSSRASSRVDPAEVDVAPDDDGDAVQRDPLDGDGPGALARPVRLGVRALDQVPGQRLDPLAAGSGRRCVPTAGRSPPARRPSPSAAASSASGGAGEDHELGAAGAEELAGSRPRAGPTWLSRPDSTARWTRSGSAGASFSVIPALRAALRSWPCRSCHSRMRRKCRNSSRQQPAEPVAGERVALLLEVLPELQEREEVGAVLVEAGVLRVGGLALLDRPLARVLHRQRGGDDQHLAQAAGAGRPRRACGPAAGRPAASAARARRR